jgi:hypothetical protein
VIPALAERCFRPLPLPASLATERLTCNMAPGWISTHGDFHWCSVERFASAVMPELLVVEQLYPAGDAGPLKVCLCTYRGQLYALNS